MEDGRRSTDGSPAEEPWKHTRWDKWFFKTCALQWAKFTDFSAGQEWYKQINYVAKRENYSDARQWQNVAEPCQADEVTYIAEFIIFRFLYGKHINVVRQGKEKFV
ncbi:MAG: hypothetical protein WAV28_03035 [Sedimentisphaerales bacterium]|jgi:hypothetical protein